MGNGKEGYRWCEMGQVWMTGTGEKGVWMVEHGESLHSGKWEEAMGRGVWMGNGKEGSGWAIKRGLASWNWERVLWLVGNGKRSLAGGKWEQVSRWW